MREPEQFVVPALGVLVLLAVFFLGSAGFYSMAYLVILGVLALAAVGTYFPPPAEQVEMRIAIAALGLLVLIFMFSSLGFWLALIGFGAIGALQIRHRGVLTTQLHTVEWLKSLQTGQEFSGALPAETEGEGGTVESGDMAQAGQAAAPASAQAGAARGGSTANIGGIGAAAFGIIVLLSFLLPWLTFSATVSTGSLGDLFGSGGSMQDVGHSESVSGLTLVRGATEAAGYDDDLAAFYAVPVVAAVIAILAVLGIASIVLPRGVPLSAGIAGVVIMVLLAIGFFAALSEIKSSEFGRYLEIGSMFGVNVSVSLGIGFWLAGLAFLLMAGLQLVFKQRA